MQSKGIGPSPEPVRSITEGVFDPLVKRLRLCVHRKGATRTLGTGSAVLPDDLAAYRPTGADPGFDGDRVVSPDWHRPSRAAPRVPLAVEPVA